MPGGSAGDQHVAQAGAQFSGIFDLSALSTLVGKEAIDLFQQSGLHGWCQLRDFGGVCHPIVPERLRGNVDGELVHCHANVDLAHPHHVMQTIRAWAVHGTMGPGHQL